MLSPSRSFGAALMALLAACTSNPLSPWPSWVPQSDVAGGVAAAEGTQASGNLSLDRTQAAAAARVTVARKLEVKIQSSDKFIRVFRD